MLPEVALSCAEEATGKRKSTNDLVKSFVLLVILRGCDRYRSESLTRIELLLVSRDHHVRCFDNRIDNFAFCYLQVFR